MADLFGRQVILSLNNRAYEDYRIDFDVTKTIGGEANEAKITIFNIPFDEGLPAAAQDRSLLVRLFAGYSTPSLIFQGNPIQGGVSYDREPTGTTLTIEAKDGYRTYKDTRINASFATGTSFKDIADEISRQMGIPTGTIKVSEKKSLTKGLVLTGDPETILERLAASTGANASIQDGALQILPESELNPNEAPLFSTENGNLLTYSDTDYGVKVKTLLESTLNPGDRFKIEHPEQSGVFKARKVTYSGSRWQTDFFTEIEAISSP